MMFRVRLNLCTRTHTHWLESANHRLTYSVSVSDFIIIFRFKLRATRFHELAATCCSLFDKQ